MTTRFEAAFAELVAARLRYEGAASVSHRAAARTRLHAARMHMARARIGEPSG